MNEVFVKIAYDNLSEWLQRGGIGKKKKENNLITISL